MPTPISELGKKAAAPAQTKIQAFLDKQPADVGWDIDELSKTLSLDRNTINKHRPNLEELGYTCQIPGTRERAWGNKKAIAAVLKNGGSR